MRLRYGQVSNVRLIEVDAVQHLIEPLVTRMSPDPIPPRFYPELQNLIVTPAHNPGGAPLKRWGIALCSIFYLEVCRRQEG